MPSLPIGRITPIIFFVILPAVLIAIGPVFFRISEKGVFALNGTADWISLYAYVIIVLIPGYHAIKRADTLEKAVKQDIQSGAVVVEFQTVKKIIIIELPIFSTIVALYFISSVIFHIGFFYYAYGPLMGGMVGALIMYYMFINDREFRFYLARACFMIASQPKDIVEQMSYFDFGLHEYDKYLKRHLKHQIKNIDKIFLKASILDNETRIKIIRSLYDSFKTENDKLKPVRYISSELMKSEDIESLLIAESLKSQLKVIGIFLATSIPIVISIITLLLTRFKF
jgi:hypothetical protein